MVLRSKLENSNINRISAVLTDTSVWFSLYIKNIEKQDAIRNAKTFSLKIYSEVEKAKKSQNLLA